MLVQLLLVHELELVVLGKPADVILVLLVDPAKLLSLLEIAPIVLMAIKENSFFHFFFVVLILNPLIWSHFFEIFVLQFKLQLLFLLVA